MKTAARLQGAIEILQMIILDGIPPEKSIISWQRGHKFAGSSDRRTISDTVYDVLRHLGTLTYYAGGKNPHLLVAAWIFYIKEQNISHLFELFSGEKHAPAPLNSQEKKIFLSPKPQPTSFEAKYNVNGSQEELWLESWGNDADKILRSFRKRSPLDLRVNLTLKDRESVLDQLQNDFPDLTFTITPYSKTGIRLSEGHINLKDYPLFQKGILDIQDESSQIICQLMAEFPVKRMLDYCAGGGGKSLTFAIHRPNQTEIIASDINEIRLGKLKERSDRSRLAIRTIAGHRLSPERGLFDMVWVDAPCSGSGTWRRNIFEKMQTTDKDIQEFTQKQLSILSESKDYVEDKGYLLYSTCSLFKKENDEVIEEFLSNNPEFSVFHNETHNEKILKTKYGLQLTPHHSHTDGFYISILQKA